MARPRLISCVNRSGDGWVLLARTLSAVFLLAMLADTPHRVRAGGNDPALDTWYVRYPLPDGRIPNEYRAVVFQNGQFIIVGSNGLIRATGGNRYSGTFNGLNAIIFANGKFVVAGDLGIILVSDDGINWANLAPASNNNLRGICFGKGTFVAVGDQGTIVVSTNLLRWSSVALTDITNQLRSVTFGNDLFVAVGESGLIFTSTNGTTWRAQSSELQTNLNAVTFASGTFVAVGAGGALLTSVNGSIWTSRTSGTTNSLNGITWWDGLFFAVGSAGRSVLSTNAISWTAYEGGWMTVDLLAVAISQHYWVTSVGRNGMITTSSPGGLERPSWVNSADWNPRDLTGVTYGGGVFIAVGYPSASLFSSNGTDWFMRPSQANGWLETVYYRNGTFLAGGSADIALMAVGATYLSYDGLGWRQQFGAWNPASFRAFAFGNDRYVAVGDGQTYGSSICVAYSRDGENWDSADLGVVANLRAITFGNGRFVANSTKIIATSTNGTVWKTQTTDRQIGGVAFGNGMFVAVGANGSIMTSEDGESWTQRDSATTNGLVAATYADGTFVAIGREIVSSTDGLNWVRHMIPTNYFPRAVTYGGGSFVAVCDGGGIIQSGFMTPRLQAERITNFEGFKITTLGRILPGGRIQSSSDLSNWQDLVVFTNQTADSSFFDRRDLDQLRFYRFKSQ